MQNIIIWLANGETMMFRNADDIETNEHVGIRFTYDGQSTGQRRKAQFYSKNIAGYSIVTDATSPAA